MQMQEAIFAKSSKESDVCASLQISGSYLAQKRTAPHPTAAASLRRIVASWFARSLPSISAACSNSSMMRLHSPRCSFAAHVAWSAFHLHTPVRTNEI